MPPPKSINLDQYTTQAAELLQHARSAQPEAFHRLRRHHPEYKSLEASGGIQLADAQFVIARENAFPSWAKFKDDLLFRNAVDALAAGDYSWLDALLDKHNSTLIDLLVAAGEPRVPMEQALTWACMLGRTRDADFLLGKGVDPLAGDNTGLNGFHYAAWHGHLDIVKLLIERRVPLEVRNMYGGTVLGSALDAVANRPTADHVAIIEMLLDAGAKIDEADYPTGNESVDEVLRHHRAKSE